MKRFRSLLGAAAVLLVALVGCAAVSIDDSQLSLRKAGVFEVLTPTPFAFPDELKVPLTPPMPGSGQPPMISHAVDEHLPITAKTNECLECHDKPQNIGKPVAAGKARPAPANHYVSRHGVLSLSGKQYNCMACHAPQAEVSPLVVNSSP
jgi:cytochrome c-type protein NapB